MKLQNYENLESEYREVLRTHTITKTEIFLTLLDDGWKPITNAPKSTILDVAKVLRGPKCLWNIINKHILVS